MSLIELIDAIRLDNDARTDRFTNLMCNRGIERLCPGAFAQGQILLQWDGHMDHLGTIRLLVHADEAILGSFSLVEIPAILLKRAIQTTVLSATQTGQLPVEDLQKLCGALKVLEENEEKS